MTLVSPTGAATVTATVTADDHYALFYGTETNLTFVGRNEYGSVGNPATGQYINFSWSLPETYAGLGLAENDRFYIAYWDESPTSGPTALLGQFTTSDGGTLLTNIAEWGYFTTAAPSPGSNGDSPSAAGIQTLIASASWSSAGETALNGTEIWAAYAKGPIPSISTQAYWLCSTTCNGSTQYLTIFRSVALSDIQGREIVATGISEPGSLALIISSLGLIGLQRRRSFGRSKLPK